MHVIGLIGDNGTDIEFVHEYVQETLANSSENTSTFIVSSNSECAARLYETATLVSNHVVSCRPSALSAEDLRVLAVLASVGASSKSLSLTMICDNDVRVENISSATITRPSTRLFSLLSALNFSSAQGDLKQCDWVLKEIKEIASEIHDSTIASDIVRQASNLRNLIAIESDFVCGNDANGFPTILTYTQKNQLYGNPLFDLKSRYTDYVSHHSPLPFQLESRIEFLDIGYDLKAAPQQAATLPKLFFWYSMYFLILARYYKNRSKFYVGALMNLRALETALQAVTVHHGRGAFGRQGRFELDGMPCSGIGIILSHVKNAYLTANDRQSFILDDVISIRNNCLTGHGFSFLNATAFDYTYSKVLSAIRCLSSKTFSDTTFFDHLRSTSKTAITSGLDILMAKTSFESLTSRIK